MLKLGKNLFKDPGGLLGLARNLSWLAPPLRVGPWLDLIRAVPKLGLAQESDLKTQF